MLNKILISFVILLLFSATHAGELELNPKHPEKYTVVRGDTLWDISAKFLTEPWRWQEIWQINPQIKNNTFRLNTKYLNFARFYLI